MLTIDGKPATLRELIDTIKMALLMAVSFGISALILAAVVKWAWQVLMR